MKRLFIVLLLLSKISFAQTNDRLKENFPVDEGLKAENLIDEYNKYDFSGIWKHTDNNSVCGIIGTDHQRLRIKLLTVEKDADNANVYLVSGKSCVKGSLCDFSGTITLREIRELKEMHFGVDSSYADLGVKQEGILIADYVFKEDAEQMHSGVFKGKLYSKWYIDAEGNMVYDDIELMSDPYLNNAFVGVWESYASGKEKICNWADYRVPITNSDFDIGAGEFSPSEKYKDKGWSDYQPLEEDKWWE